MKHLYLITAVFFLTAGYSFSQTNISGIINTYRSVSAITNSGCSVCSNPACYSDITVSSSAGFVAGGTALIIQMQGAVIDQTNSTNFGNVTNNNNTGNFEYVTVQSIPNGTTVRVSTLALTYSVPSSPIPGVTQLINVPVYAGDVNVNGTLTAQAWNGATGGVLSFIASGKVTLNANIDVSGLGFRGYPHHAPSNGDCLETAYFLSEATQRNQGALKGEGIALVIANKERGRGKQSNGGGGGIGHNGGGGGGGNGGAGGFGGQMYEGCPNIAGRGEGGLLLTGSSTRVYMGGGGGTGDNNATGALDPGSDATNGGGIIIIMADSIVNPNTSVGYTGTSGPTNPTIGGYYDNNYAAMIEFDVFCQLTINSIVVNSQAAQTLTISVRAPDKTTVVATRTLAVPAGVSTVPVNLAVPPGRGYFMSAQGSTGSLYRRGNATAAYPYNTPDVISIKYADPPYVGAGGESPYFFDWNVTSRCAAGGFKINASGIDNPGVADSDGGGGGGAGGSIYIKANGYRGIINMMATGGEGGDMINGGCHAPGGGGGGGYICMNSVPTLVNVNRNVKGADPGEIPDAQASCWTAPVTGYNSNGATKGGAGMLCTVNLINPTCPLPVEFISFTGWKEHNQNRLDWKLAMEHNNNYFTVERSSNGIDFTVIGTIISKGNSSSVRSYQFTDQQPSGNINYYRLKQTDYDGTSSYSKIIALYNAEAIFDIYPNPSSGGPLQIKLSASQQSYKIEVADVKGSVVYASSGASVPEELTVSSLTAGIYMVRLYIDNQVYSKKLVIY